MKVFAIDPSINHLGLALMVPGSLLAFETIEAPTEFKQEELVSRLDWMINELDDAPYGFTESLMIAIECPEPWGAYKSMASSRSGSLQMLTLLVGAIAYWALTIVSIENVKLVKVSTWKGQLPKSVTKKRMEKKYNCKFATDHESDACGLGDYVLTKEQNGQRK